MLIVGGGIRYKEQPKVELSFEELIAQLNPIPLEITWGKELYYQLEKSIFALEKLLEKHGQAITNPDMVVAVKTQIADLRKNDRESRIFGDSEQVRKDRSKIIYNLNSFMLKWTGNISFNDLSQKEMLDSRVI